MHRVLRDAGLAVGWVAFVACGNVADRAPIPAAVSSAAAVAHTRVIETRPMKIDRIYHSMDGPHERLPIDPGGLDWITGYSTRVIDAESRAPLADEFFCHSQMQLLNATRLLVTATGTASVRFPAGFGMPLRRILAGMPAEYRGVSVLGMILNNHDPGMNRLARVQATIEYMSDNEAAAAGLKKLYKVELPMTVVPKTGDAADDPGGEHCVVVGGLKSHWLVPPGPQTTRKRYRDLFPVDSTVHFAAVHLHNYGQSMLLRDVTTGETLWKTEVGYEPTRVQIASIPQYSSPTGFPVFKDHEYEIEAFYDNATTTPTDAMAVMYLFYRPTVDVDITYPTPASRVSASDG